jgi:putative PIN family toxin of toxin-antitoxin system
VSPVPKARAVFDTNVVLSALLFTRGRLSWLVGHWQTGNCLPLASRATAAELVRILAYPKFRLFADEQLEALSAYLPCCEAVEIAEPCPIFCRDANDQPFLDLAQSGKADVLVTGDKDLLALAGQTTFVIDMPEDYRRRVAAAEKKS